MRIDRRPHIILKGISVLLLFSVVYMYSCSVLCIADSSECCKCCVDNDGCHESSCSKNEKKDNNCQAIHLSFFNALGQYHFFGNNDVKAPSVIASLIYSPAVIQPLLINAQELIYNSHSPPKNDIKIRLCSLQV